MYASFRFAVPIFQPKTIGMSRNTMNPKRNPVYPYFIKFANGVLTMPRSYANIRQTHTHTHSWIGCNVSCVKRSHRVRTFVQMEYVIAFWPSQRSVSVLVKIKVYVHQWICTHILFEPKNSTTCWMEGRMNAIAFKRSLCVRGYLMCAKNEYEYFSIELQVCVRLARHIVCIAIKPCLTRWLYAQAWHVLDHKIIFATDVWNDIWQLLDGLFIENT